MGSGMSSKHSYFLLVAAIAGHSIFTGCTGSTGYVEGSKASRPPATVKVDNSGDASKTPVNPAAPIKTASPVVKNGAAEPQKTDPVVPNVVVGVLQEAFKNATTQPAAENVQQPAVTVPQSAPIDPKIEAEIPQADCPMYANTSSRLYCVRDNAPELVGAFQYNGGSFSLVTDIAISLGGRIYAISPSALYLVNPTNASLSLVRSLDISEANALTVLSDGRLVVAGRGVAILDLDKNQSYTIASTSTYSSSGDIVGLPDKKLYWSVKTASGDKLVVVDAFAGTTRELGVIGQPSVLGLAYASGVLYGFSEGGKIFTIDQQSGSAVSVIKTDSTRWWGATTNPVKW